MSDSRVPETDHDFNDYINSTADYLLQTDSAGLDNWERLALTEAEKDQWVAYKNDWNTKYGKVLNNQSLDIRDSNAIKAKNDARDAFNDWVVDPSMNKLNRIAASPDVTDPDRSKFNIKKRDSEPTPRPHIETMPSVTLKPKGGGRIHIECRVESDSTRPSMHPDADLVELRYKLGDPPPDKPAEATNGFNSSRSNWMQQIDLGDLGKTFYCYARWANTSDESKSGPWSQRDQVIVA